MNFLIFLILNIQSFNIGGHELDLFSSCGFHCSFESTLTGLRMFSIFEIHTTVIPCFNTCAQSHKVGVTVWPQCLVVASVVTDEAIDTCSSFCKWRDLSQVTPGHKHPCFSMGFPVLVLLLLHHLLSWWWKSTGAEYMQPAPRCLGQTFWCTVDHEIRSTLAVQGHLDFVSVFNILLQFPNWTLFLLSHSVSEDTDCCLWSVKLLGLGSQLYHWYSGWFRLVSFTGWYLHRPCKRCIVQGINTWRVSHPVFSQQRWVMFSSSAQ
jgi:hypothetical protein